MVVFTCTHCGDSLQKPKVEKHYSFVCKTVKSLTCVDCLKDFRGEEYATHTKCVTEDERYAAKGTYTNGIVKKGEVKQESWMEMIKSILDSDQNLNPPCRNLLNTISSYSNVPRKKHKFINFIKSSSGGRMNMNVIEDVWNIIEKYKNDKLKNDRNEKTDPEKSQNGSNGISEKEKNSKTEENEVKKRKADEETGDVPKKKKHKNVTEQSAKEVTEESPNTIQNDEDTPKKKKHRTKKGQENEQVILGNDNINENSDKAPKKKKKSKTEKDMLSADTVSKTENIDVSAKKKKHQTEKEEEVINKITEDAPKKKKKNKGDNKQDDEITINTEQTDVGTEEDVSVKDTTDKKIVDIQRSEDTLKENNVESVSVPDNETKFNFTAKILELVTQKGSISTKKLQKKVLNAYLKETGEPEVTQKMIGKFSKKLKKTPNLNITDDTVTIVETL